MSTRAQTAPEAFYEPVGDGYAATELTRGPWGGDSQHAGPPSALIAREIERCEGVGEGPDDRMVGRITLEILRPVPIGRLTVTARVARPGRRVDLVEAVLADGEGPLVLARAWRHAVREVELPDGVAGSAPGSPAQRAGRPGGGTGPLREPQELGANEAFFPTGHELGYHVAMDVRFVAGGFLEPGPAAAWMRMAVPLIAGEEPTPLQRVMIAADSGNGISSTLDFERYLFVNVDLSVHLHRTPDGEWVCLDALTVPEPSGAGMSDTMLLDRRGPIGRACQTLMVAER